MRFACAFCKFDVDAVRKKIVKFGPLEAEILQ